LEIRQRASGIDDPSFGRPPYGADAKDRQVLEVGGNFILVNSAGYACK